MNKVISTVLRPKKVELRDVASPTPSRAASRAIDGAIKRAHSDQQSVSRKAQLIRGN